MGGVTGGACDHLAQAAQLVADPGDGMAPYGVGGQPQQQDPDELDGHRHVGEPNNLTGQGRQLQRGVDGLVLIADRLDRTTYTARDALTEGVAGLFVVTGIRIACSTHASNKSHE